MKAPTFSGLRSRHPATGVGESLGTEQETRRRLIPDSAKHLGYNALAAAGLVGALVFGAEKLVKSVPASEQNAMVAEGFAQQGYEISKKRGILVDTSPATADSPVAQIHVYSKNGTIDAVFSGKAAPGEDLTPDATSSISVSERRQDGSIISFSAEEKGNDWQLNGSSSQAAIILGELRQEDAK